MKKPASWVSDELCQSLDMAAPPRGNGSYKCFVKITLNNQGHGRHKILELRLPGPTWLSVRDILDPLQESLPGSDITSPGDVLAFRLNSMANRTIEFARMLERCHGMYAV